MKELRIANRFTRDLKRVLKRGLDRNKIEYIVTLLRSSVTLPAAARNHKLTGDWLGTWECHIEPNWLLIYEIGQNEIVLHRTGTHSDLFE